MATILEDSNGYFINIKVKGDVILKYKLHNCLLQIYQWNAPNCYDPDREYEFRYKFPFAQVNYDREYLEYFLDYLTEICFHAKHIDQIDYIDTLLLLSLQLEYKTEQVKNKKYKEGSSKHRGRLLFDLLKVPCRKITKENVFSFVSLDELKTYVRIEYCTRTKQQLITTDDEINLESLSEQAWENIFYLIRKDSNISVPIIKEETKEETKEEAKEKPKEEKREETKEETKETNDETKEETKETNDETKEEEKEEKFLIVSKDIDLQFHSAIADNPFRPIHIEPHPFSNRDDFEGFNINSQNRDLLQLIVEALVAEQKAYDSDFYKELVKHDFKTPADISYLAAYVDPYLDRYSHNKALKELKNDLSKFIEEDCERTFRLNFVFKFYTLLGVLLKNKKVSPHTDLKELKDAIETTRAIIRTKNSYAANYFKEAFRQVD